MEDIFFPFFPDDARGKTKNAREQLATTIQQCRATRKFVADQLKKTREFITEAREFVENAAQFSTFSKLASS